MTIEGAIRDYHGSYLLGEADGEHWLAAARYDQIQHLASLGPDDFAGPGPTLHQSSPWPLTRAVKYGLKDPRFHEKAYLAGFLKAVRRTKQRLAFAPARRNTRQ